MRSFAFVVTMLIACAGKQTPPPEHVKSADCETGGCSKAPVQDCGSNTCEVKTAKQDCGSNGCDKQGTATEPVYAGTCEGAACANELTRKWNATQPKPEMDCDTFNCGKTGKAEAKSSKPCDNDPNCGGVTPKPCDNDPTCGGVTSGQAASSPAPGDFCEAPPC